ncbi:jg19190 [Pararge aegeria aegeria]|uniref:Jg19190 protein n=1 Tax=Pararge aegeria aegeria TaxID=348720 RepID=A0A8S4R7E7_9NEOP|nr:jg19190 [Pararge aegeria aegeria]
MGEAHSLENWGPNVLEWRPRTCKSVGRPPSIWTLQSSRRDPLKTSGTGPGCLDLSTKDPCPAVTTARPMVGKMMMMMMMMIKQKITKGHSLLT